MDMYYRMAMTHYANRARQTIYWDNTNSTHSKHLLFSTRQQSCQSSGTVSQLKKNFCQVKILTCQGELNSSCAGLGVILTASCLLIGRIDMAIGKKCKCIRQLELREVVIYQIQISTYILKQESTFHGIHQ